MGHFGFVYTGETHDLLHELIFALIVGMAAVGLLTQLRKPFENFAGQLVALIAWIAMILTAAITGNFVPQPLFIIFGGLTILATVLHPKGRGLFNWFSTARINRALAGLVIIAAIPLLILAFTNINLQIAGGGTAGFFDHRPPTKNVVAGNDHDQGHSTPGHYRNLAALSLIIILVGLLASFRPSGWRIAARVAGSLPILLGLASIILPKAESSLGIVWGLVAIIWGIAFITTAELTKSR